MTRRPVLLMVLLLAGCSNPLPPGRPSSGAPPVTFCGKTLYAGAAGLPVYRPPLAPGTYVNPMDPRGGPPLLVQTADDCGHGARIVISPTGLVAVVNEVRAADGRPVALSLSGLRPGTGALTVIGGGPVHGAVPLVVVDPSQTPGEPTNGVTVP